MTESVWKETLRKLRNVDRNIGTIPNLIIHDRGDLEQMLEKLQMDCDNLIEIVKELAEEE